MLWYSYMSEAEKDKYINRLLEKIDNSEMLDEIESEVIEQYESNGDIKPLAIKGISHLCF